MEALNSRHLYTLHADLRLPEWNLGQTPLGRRRIFDVTGGRLEGRVSGTLLPSGGDWILADADGCLRLDVRITAELDDGAMVYMAYQGRIWFPPDVLPLLTGHEAAAEVDPSRYYMRVAPFFETASEKYRWLNHVAAVGVGRITKTGVAYEAYEVL
jgi:hypothetical protein